MQINQNILQVLSAATTEGNTVVLNGQLDRALYTQVNKVLEAAGGKWDRKAKAHVFATDAEDRMDQIIVSGSIDIPKDEFEFFQTQPKEVDRMHKAADIKMGHLILEPSAGRAALLNGLNKADVLCVEKMPANADYLTEQGYRVIRGDFLDVPKNPIYDRVLMNPPFSKGQDVAHVTHALGFLKPGGKLVAIMSGGVIYRQNKRTAEFRELVGIMGGTIEPLPEGAFKISGTMANTVIVEIKK